MSAQTIRQAIAQALPFERGRACRIWCECMVCGEILPHTRHYFHTYKTSSKLRKQCKVCLNSAKIRRWEHERRQGQELEDAMRLIMSEEIQRALTVPGDKRAAIAKIGAAYGSPKTWDRLVQAGQAAGLTMYEAECNADRATGRRALRVAK